MNKFIKYGSRIVLGLFTIFWGLATYFAYTPDESYHHCEAGQNDGNPIYVALIAIASLLFFCFVWYITKDKRSVYSIEKSPEEDLPEPFKSYVEFDNYMSELKWVKIENEDEIASVSGFYLYKCRSDNHYFHEFHELEKGEKLCKNYLDHHFEGWAVVVPESYHIVENVEGEYMMKNWSWVDNSMSFAPHDDELIRWADGILKKRGEPVFIEKGYKWIKADTLLELRKIASRNNCQRIKDIQLIEEISSIGESFEPETKGFISWKKSYLGVIECSEEEKEVLITNIDPNDKQFVTKLQVHKNRGHLFGWNGEDGQYLYFGNVPLETIKDKVEEDVYDERFKCKDSEMCKLFEKIEQENDFSFYSY